MYKANYIVDETGKIRELAPEDFELFKSQELSKKGKQDLLKEELENLKIKRKDLYDQIKEDKTSDNLLKAMSLKIYLLGSLPLWLKASSREIYL